MKWILKDIVCTSPLETFPSTKHYCSSKQLNTQKMDGTMETIIPVIKGSTHWILEAKACFGLDYPNNCLLDPRWTWFECPFMLTSLFTFPSICPNRTQRSSLDDFLLYSVLGLLGSPLLVEQGAPVRAKEASASNYFCPAGTSHKGAFLCQVLVIISWGFFFPFQDTSWD